jgi:hypothetical protein
MNEIQRFVTAYPSISLLNGKEVMVKNVPYEKYGPTILGIIQNRGTAARLIVKFNYSSLCMNPGSFKTWN